MSLEGLFPSTGSFTGSTRNQVVTKAQESSAECQKSDNVTVSASQSPSKMEPVNVSSNLLSEDILAEVFAIVAGASQNTGPGIKEFVVMTGDENVTREVTSALQFSAGPDVEIIAEGNDIITIEHPATKNSFAYSVTGTYTEIENMGAPKATGNVFIAA